MRVVGLGDNVIDIWEGSGVAYPGGNAVNVAVSAVRLGCEGIYLGTVSNDRWGRALMGALRAEDVDVSRCRIADGATTKLCWEVPDGRGHRCVRTDRGESWPGYVAMDALQEACALSADAILTSCNAKMTCDLPRLDARQGVLSFDFGEQEKYLSAQYLAKVAPHIDFAQFSCSGMTEGEAAELHRSIGLTCPVLMTRGSEEPILFAGDRRILGRAAEGEAVDTLGAGDSFIAALVIGLLRRGWSRGHALPEDEVVVSALRDAADHAARMCQEHGAFGHQISFARPSAVVFDNDGVIVDTEPLYAEQCKEFVRTYGAEMTAEDVHALRGASDEQQAKIISRYTGLTCEATQELVLSYMREHQPDFASIVMPGVRGLIAELDEAGIPIGMASSSPLGDLLRVVDQCGLEGRFDVIASGGQYEESKPNPRIYLDVIDRLGSVPGSTIVIEDSPYGIEAGVRAGAEVLALRLPGFDVDHHEAGFAFDSHQQILDYLRDRLSTARKGGEQACTQ